MPLLIEDRPVECAEGAYVMWILKKVGVEILKESQVNGKETETFILEEGYVDIANTFSETLQSGDEIVLFFYTLSFGRAVFKLSANERFDIV